MRLSQKITGFLHNGVSTLWYFAVMAVKENFRNYVGRAGRTEGALSDELALLANGPSLADELPRLLAGARAGCDFLAVNYFAEHEAFERLRPAYYVLSDPQFFRASAQRDRVAALYRTLARKVTWPMTLYVQYYNPERFDYRAALPNGHIRIVPFHTQPYRGFRSSRYLSNDRHTGRLPISQSALIPALSSEFPQVPAKAKESFLHKLPHSENYSQKRNPKEQLHKKRKEKQHSLSALLFFLQTSGDSALYHLNWCQAPNKP